MDVWQQLRGLIEQLWTSQPDMLGLRDLLLAFVIFIIFAIFRGLLSRFVLSRLERLTKRSKTEIDDWLVKALDRPFEFIVLSLGVFFAVQVLPFSGLVKVIADNAVQSLFVFGVFWILHALTDPLSHMLRRLEDILTSEIINWLGSVVRWSIIALGAATILQIWGIQVAPIIAGFGLFGVAVALGAQDLFKNLLAGLSILLEQRFRVGDWVEVTGVVEGVVEQIGFRSTRIRRFDRAPVTVPNNVFADHAVINYAGMTHRRIFWRIGLVYHTSSEQLVTIQKNIMDWLAQNPAFVDPPELPCHVYIEGFSDCSIDILIYVFTSSSEWQDWLGHRQDLALAVKKIVQEAGSDFAFPSRTVYVENSGSNGLANAGDAENIILD